MCVETGDGARPPCNLRKLEPDQHATQQDWGYVSKQAAAPGRLATREGKSPINMRHSGTGDACRSRRWRQAALQPARANKNEDRLVEIVHRSIGGEH